MTSTGSTGTEPDWEAWQQQWDAQQESYLPDREQRFAAMLDALEAIGTATDGGPTDRPTAAPGHSGYAPRILDLAGGTGSITRRVLARFPQATAVVLDIDAALLRIARGTFEGDPRVQVVAVNLALEDWVTALEKELGRPAAGAFDAVLTATALHWLQPEQVAAVYAQARTLLRPGGLCVNADHMPDPGLASLTDGLARVEQAVRVRRQDAGTPDWQGWWDLLRVDPVLAGPTAERDAFYAERSGNQHSESLLPSTWHLEALRAGGYAETGLIWRGLLDAAVVGRTSG